MLVDEIEEIILVVNEMSQLFVLSSRNVSWDHLLDPSWLLCEFQRGVGLLLDLLSLGLNNNVSILDHGVTQKLNDDDQNLETTLPDCDCLIELLHGLGLHFKLLVALSQVGLILLLVGLEHIFVVLIGVFALDVLEFLVLLVDILDCIE